MAISIDHDIFTYLLYITTIGYLTHILLLDSIFIVKRSHKRIEIHPSHYMDDTYMRYYDYMDDVRKWIITYESKSEMPGWLLVSYNNRTQLFLCPYCLSFWINLLLATPLLLAGYFTIPFYLLTLFGIPYLVGRWSE